MKKAACVMALVWAGCLLCTAAPFKTISSKEAFGIVRQPDTFLIDVRSVTEYVFAGHPEMAYNIPLTFCNEAQAKMEGNLEFAQDLLRRFQKSDRLIFRCLSGGRSDKAARTARKAGFLEMFNGDKRFEGDINSRGYRTVDGWKSNGLPCTYALNRELT